MKRTLLIFVVVVLGASVLPFSIKSALHTNDSVIHPILHLAVFAVVSFMACHVGKTRYRFLTALVASVAFGAIVEVLEAVVYHQKVEMTDIVLDTYGAVFGLVVSALVRSLSPRPKPYA